MHTAVLGPNFYSALAVSVLLVHALFILWVVFGAFLTGSRPILRWLHIGSLVWGILTELLPWPCPLTLLENWLEGKAGVERPQRMGVRIAPPRALRRRSCAVGRRPPLNSSASYSRFRPVTVVAFGDPRLPVD